MVLRTLGLLPDEASVYSVVASRRHVQRDKLGALVGLPARDVQVAVEGLVDRGLVHMDTGASGGEVVVAAPPDLAGEALLLEQMTALHAAREELARLTDAYRASAGAGVEDFIEFLPVHAISARFAQIQDRARNQVVIVDSPPYASETLDDPIQVERLASEVTYRTIYSRASIDQLPGGYARIRSWVQAGEQARVLDQALSKFAIVDGEFGLLPLLHPDSQSFSGALLISKSPLLDTLSSFFEMLWMCALPLESLRSDALLSDEDRELLTLLLAGFTDDRICRQLGVARRTVLRRVRALMDRAGVATRIQLGWQAAQLGWVTAPWQELGLRRNDVPNAASEGTRQSPMSQL